MVDDSCLGIQRRKRLFDEEQVFTSGLQNLQRTFKLIDDILKSFNPAGLPIEY